MTFGQKIRQTRRALHLSQSELAHRTGISERSLYAYEQMEVLPRSGNIQKLASALNVSVSFLLDENETNCQKNMERDLFLANVKDEYGYKGAREASEILSRASALFAGGELDEESKDVFFRSLMEVYLESKEEARIKFSSHLKNGQNKNG